MPIELISICSSCMMDKLCVLCRVGGSWYLHTRVLYSPPWCLRSWVQFLALLESNPHPLSPIKCQMLWTQVEGDLNLSDFGGQSLAIISSMESLGGWWSKWGVGILQASPWWVSESSAWILVWKAHAWVQWKGILPLLLPPVQFCYLSKHRESTMHRTFLWHALLSFPHDFSILMISTYLQSTVTLQETTINPILLICSIKMGGGRLSYWFQQHAHMTSLLELIRDAQESGWKVTLKGWLNPKVKSFISNRSTYNWSSQSLTIKRLFFWVDDFQLFTINVCVLLDNRC